MSLAREYDRWHEHVFRSCPEHSDGNEPWHRLVLEHLVPVGGRRILEVACGRGGFARVLASMGASVLGSDFSGSALRIAQERARQSASATSASLVRADAHRLPYPSNSFDVVISCETIEHLPDPSAALREMERVCRPAGWLYVTTPNYLNLMGLYHVYAVLFGRKLASDGSQPLDRSWLFVEVRQKVRKAGWKIVRSDGTVHQVPLPRRNPVRLELLERIGVIRRALSPFASHYMLIARKRGLTG